MQAAINVIRVRVVRAHVIKLRNRQVELMLPAIAAVFAAPQAAIVAGNHGVWILWVDPHIVEVAVRRARNHVERLSSIVAQQQNEIGFENLVFIFWIDDEVTEIKRTPHHVIAGIQLGPRRSSVVGAVKPSSFFGFDVGIDHLRFGCGNLHRDSAIGFRWESLGIAVVHFAPLGAAVGGLEDPASRTSRTERPTLPPKIPHRCIDCLRILRTPRNHRAAARTIRAREHLLPVLAAVGRLENSALVVVIPQMPGGTGEHVVAVSRIHQELGDVFAVF